MMDDKENIRTSEKNSDLVGEYRQKDNKMVEEISSRDSLKSTSSPINIKHISDEVKHQPTRSPELSASSYEEDMPDKTPSPTFFPPEFWQRSPSPHTIKSMTMTKSKKYDTFPRSQAEAAKIILHQAIQDGFMPKLDDNPLSSEKGAIITDSDMNISETYNIGISKKEYEISRVRHAYAETKESVVKCTEDPDNTFIKEPVLNKDSFKALEGRSQNDLSSESLADSACMECIKAIQVFSKHDIQPGDHIAFPGRIYNHHAIVVGVCGYESKCNVNEAHIEIVHATNTAAKAAFAILHPFGNKARLRQVNIILNFKESKVMVYEYNSKIYPFSPSEIVNRAIEAAAADKEGKNSKYKYNLLENNCEHFATWCVTGKKLSIQVRKFTMVFWMFLKSGFYDISDESIRNEKEYENGMLCKTCYKRNKHLLDVPHPYIYSSDDVEAGDIIIYSYYFLWHNAIVLRIIKRRHNYIKCEIAHYAYLGPFHHRQIIKEEVLIPLDGTVMVLRYPEGDFDVFENEEVVQRANIRIGEQMFSFFTNDSGQFSRWCKLKL